MQKQYKQYVLVFFASQNNLYIYLLFVLMIFLLNFGWTSTAAIKFPWLEQINGSNTDDILGSVFILANFHGLNKFQVAFQQT